MLILVAGVELTYYKAIQVATSTVIPTLYLSKTKAIDKCSTLEMWEQLVSLIT